MNKSVIAALLLVAVLAGAFNTNSGSYIPLTTGSQNVINFGCGMGDSYKNVAGVSSAGYTYTYANLPSWVSVVNGPMLAGTPTSGTPTAIVVYYTDANGNQGNQTVVLAGSGTSTNTLVNLPTGTNAGNSGNVARGSSNSGWSISGSSSTNTVNLNSFSGGSLNFGNGGRIPISQIPSIQYVPGSTSPAPGATFNDHDNSGGNTNLVTVVLPALQYPTPGRISIVPPEAPTAGAQLPSAITTNPQDTSVIISRQEASIKGLANALDALNKANINFNNLQNQVPKNQDDLNNAFVYLQNTQNALKAAQYQQANNSQQATTISNDIKNLQSQVDAANQDITNLKNNINSLQSNLGNAGPALAAAQQTLVDINNNISALSGPINDAKNAIVSANNRITTLQQTITNTQNTLNNYPNALNAANQAVSETNDRVERARKELAAALAAQAAANDNLTQLQNTKNNASTILSEANSQISQIKNNLPGLNSNLANLQNQLSALQAAATAAQNNITTIQTSAGELGRQLAGLQNNLQARIASLNAYQSQLVQANQSLIPIKNNQGVLDDNVNTLLEQLGLANNNVNNARSAGDDIAVQIKNAQNLIAAAQVALEKARTEKALSDQEVNEAIKQQGGTFPYPYTPGSGPYAMPGVTGNPGTGTVNPYAPGTIFGTGRGTTGTGANSGLPIAAAPGSPYNQLVSPTAGVSPNMIVSAAQAANVSPSSLYPAGSGTYTPGIQGYTFGQGLYATTGAIGTSTGTTTTTTSSSSSSSGSNGSGSGGCFSSFAGSNVLSGSGVITSAGTNWYGLHSGYKVYTAPCTTGCQAKVGDNINWNGYSQQGAFLATKLICPSSS